MMRSFLAATGLVLLCTTAAAAQDSRVSISVNAGTRANSQEFRQSAEFPLYDETGTWEAPHEIKGGAFFDLGAGYRVMRNLSIGAAYSMNKKDTRDVTVTASVPSPVFFETVRTATGAAFGLEHSEKALHLQAWWHLPVTVEFEVILFGGPTFFTVEDALVEAISISEVGDDFSAVNIDSVNTAAQDHTTSGFNVGIDTRYMFMQNVGLGAMLRYSRGTVELTPPAGTASGPIELNAGGLEIAAGLRFRF